MNKVYGWRIVANFEDPATGVKLNRIAWTDFGPGEKWRCEQQAKEMNANSDGRSTFVIEPINPR